MRLPPAPALPLQLACCCLLPACRYGSGLVIYWFGYLADLANDAEVLILDRCPSAQEIRLLPQLQLALGA